MFSWDMNFGFVNTINSKSDSTLQEVSVLRERMIRQMNLRALHVGTYRAGKPFPNR